MNAAPFIALGVIALCLIIPGFLIALSRTRNQNQIRESAKTLSDQDILEYLAQGELEIYTMEYVAQKFGVPRKIMKKRIAQLRKTTHITWLNYGKGPQFSLARELPTSTGSMPSDELTLEVLQYMHQRYEGEFSGAELILETGINSFDLLEPLKHFVKTKVLSVIHHHEQGKLYLLNPSYQRVELSALPQASTELLEQIREIASGNGGQISATLLAERHAIDKEQANLKLKSLAEQELLAITKSADAELVYVVTKK